MPEPATANIEAAAADLATARASGDEGRVALLEALIECGGVLLIYRPGEQHYGVLFGDLDDSLHVAVMVPGVGGEVNLCHEWIPAAMNLFEAADSTAVILWKGYDNPSDPLRAAMLSFECDEHLMSAGGELAEFVSSLPVRPEQTLTIVAHSFGSIVTGAALADHGLVCTDVVVAGSPGLTVDDLRELHLGSSHFFSEQAPGDVVAELGIFGASPSSPTFGGTRMRTNAPGHTEVASHGSYFLAGSEALENIVDVVTGRYSSVLARRSSVSEMAGGLVAWTIRMPTVPVRAAIRHYRGPGFRVLIDTIRMVDLFATQTGNLVRDGIDEGAKRVSWISQL